MEETIRYFDNQFSVKGIDIAYISKPQWEEIRAALVEVQKPAPNFQSDEIAPRSCLSCENHGFMVCDDCMQFSHYKARHSHV